MRAPPKHSARTVAILRKRDFSRTHRALRGLGILPGDQPGQFDSLGFTLFEWLNPEIVRAEREAIGAAPASDVPFGDVIGAALEDTRDVVTGAAGEIAEGAKVLGAGAQKVALGVGVAAVLAALVYFSQKGRK